MYLYKIEYNIISNEKKKITIDGEANRGALRPVGICVVQAGVAALILDSDRLDVELTVGQGGTQPDSPLEQRLNHGVAPLCKGGHLCGVSLCRSVCPGDLLHLFRQPVGAREGGLLAAHCCLVSIYCDVRWNDG